MLKVTKELLQAWDFTSIHEEFKRVIFLTWVPWQDKKHTLGPVREMVFFETHGAGPPVEFLSLASPLDTQG